MKICFVYLWCILTSLTLTFLALAIRINDKNVDFKLDSISSDTAYMLNECPALFPLK